MKRIWILAAVQLLWMASVWGGVSEVLIRADNMSGFFVVRLADTEGRFLQDEGVKFDEEELSRSFVKESSWKNAAYLVIQNQHPSIAASVVRVISKGDAEKEASKGVLRVTLRGTHHVRVTGTPQAVLTKPLKNSNVLVGRLQFETNGIKWTHWVPLMPAKTAGVYEGKIVSPPESGVFAIVDAKGTGNEPARELSAPFSHSETFRNTCYSFVKAQ